MPTRKAIEQRAYRERAERKAAMKRREQQHQEAVVAAMDRGVPDEGDGWQMLGHCRQVNPELFFPESGDGLPVGTYRQAQRICRTCPVIDRCLEHALRHDEQFGIWGGTTPNERRKLLNKAPKTKQRARASA